MAEASKFALVRNGIVFQIFDADPKLGNSVDVRDVSSLKDIAEGWSAKEDGTYAAPDVPEVGTAPIPSVTRAQAKIQLLRTKGKEDGKTLLDDVTDAVKAEGGEVEIWFNDASTWSRMNPNVVALGKGLGLSSDDIDGLFKAAAQIDA